MRFSLGALLLAALALAASSCGSSHPASSPPLSDPTVSSSRLILGGTVRCTASLTKTVQAGQALGISFAFHNVSTHTVNVQLSYGGMWVRVVSPDGTTYDTRVPLENSTGPPREPIPVRPGATLTRRLRGLRARWKGPLRITPGCGLPELPPVRVAVTSPGLPASATAAVSDVVAATDHLLDNCRPSTSAVSVVGQIDPPSGDAPPLQARCSVSLTREGSFYVAQVLVVTPPDLQGVHVEQPYEALTGTNFRNENTQAIAWQFVVTREGATSVDSAEWETTRSGGAMAPGWFWGSSGPLASDDNRCGASGGGSGNANGPEVDFVSICGP